MHPHRLLTCCVSGAYPKATSVSRHRGPCFTSRRAPKGAVEECIHRQGDGIPIGLFARQEQAAANKTLDVSIVQFQPIAAKALRRRCRLRRIRSAAPPRAVLVFATIGVATLWFIGRVLRAIFYSFSRARRRSSFLTGGVDDRREYSDVHALPPLTR
jgi:hypothetical protein